MKTPAEEKPKARRSRTQDQGSTRSGKERVEAAMIAAKAAKARIWPTVAIMRTPIKQPAAKPTEWQATTMPMLVVEKSSMVIRSEEHTSELQSLMRISYAVFCLKKKQNIHEKNKYNIRT